MNYNFNDNTLLHSVMFNPFKLESILQNGIMSFNEASKSNFLLREILSVIILMIIFQ